LIKVSVEDEAGAKLANIIGIFPHEIPAVRILKPEGDEPEDVVKF